ncbi:N-acetyl-gamma-glutamyl-phosphate reductase [Spirochaeta cellobiosiphila]|uniref:N-acetyl-gamma-glutamyl-phosphate reductase n=1 Tax=Spirochaeta cellobiosiphila TaxID=504483 RepID=UPI0003F77424|nr:N-acetyl-gamma-glutamyl-phosphate reductase [Spirochaeta cellobiosiphila]
MKAAVLGATGYTGQLLLKLLNNHEKIDQIMPVTTSQVGQSISKSLPRLGNSLNRKTQLTKGCFISREEALKESPDVVFAALPHLKSAPFAEPFLDKSVLIDLSADYRLKDPEVFAIAYGQRPPVETRLKDSVYGLCEWNRQDIKKSNIIAVPGCYPTATLLPLLPFANKGLIKGSIIVNALSGISGAGKKLAENYLYVERDENCGPYAPGKVHRHSYEIEHYIHGEGSSEEVYFTPNLVPMVKGMTVTSTFYAPDLSETGAMDLLQEFYSDQPCIGLREDLPQSADVAGSNRCDIAIRKSGNQIFLFSAIDNLMKGASGSAIQNFNIRFGWDDSLGLPLSAEV